jgi:hypothetical protein
VSNNVAIYITPRADDPELGSTFLGALTAVDDVEGSAPLAELLPPNWEGKYTPHFYEIKANFAEETNVAWNHEFFKDLGITHVALLEGPKDKRLKGPYYFGNVKIEENSVVCWYRAGKGDFYFLHCSHCGIMLLQWIVERQEAWYADCQSEPQASKARN